MRRVRSLSTTVLALAVAVLAVLAITTGPAQARTWAVPKAKAVAATVAAPTNLDAYENQLIVEINKARRANSLRRIAKFDSCTDRMAEQWGERIVTTGAFEHRDQNQVIKQCRSSWAGEALIRGLGLTPKSMVEAWLDSPGHRAILLNTKAQFAGVAVAQDSRGYFVGVLNVTRR